MVDLSSVRRRGIISGNGPQYQHPKVYTCYFRRYYKLPVANSDQRCEDHTLIVQYMVIASTNNEQCILCFSMIRTGKKQKLEKSPLETLDRVIDNCNMNTRMLIVVSG